MEGYPDLRPHHQGVSLSFKATSQDYLNSIHIMERYRIYTLSGQYRL